MYKCVHVIGNGGGDMGNMRLYVPPSSFALRLSSFLFLSLSDISFTFQGGLYIGHATGRVKIRQNQARLNGVVLRQVHQAGEYWRIDTSVGLVDYWVYGSDVLAMCNVWARGCRVE